MEKPFVCNLGALTPAQRGEHQALTARLAGAVVKTHELPDGYALEIERSRLPMVDVTAWIEFERRCCPFFDFTLDWRRDDGPTTLRLTGRGGVKPFIEAEFAQIFR
jgi:hypothetical protein